VLNSGGVSGGVVFAFSVGKGILGCQEEGGVGTGF
jgi:hypothetical protein